MYFFGNTLFVDTCKFIYLFIYLKDIVKKHFCLVQKKLNRGFKILRFP